MSRSEFSAPVRASLTLPRISSGSMALKPPPPPRFPTVCRVCGRHACVILHMYSPPSGLVRRRYRRCGVMQLSVVLVYLRATRCVSRPLSSVFWALWWLISFQWGTDRPETHPKSARARSDSQPTARRSTFSTAFVYRFRLVLSESCWSPTALPDGYLCSGGAPAPLRPSECPLAAPGCRVPLLASRRTRGSARLPYSRTFPRRLKPHRRLVRG